MTPADHANTVRKALVGLTKPYYEPAAAALDALETQAETAEDRYDKAVRDIGRLQAERERLAEARDAVLRYCDQCDRYGGMPSTATLRAALETERTE